MRKFYETIFIIDSTSEDSAVEETINSVTNLIQSSGYVIRQVDRWGKKRLAYEVKKHKEGFYVLMVLETEPDFVSQLQRHYQLSESIIKYMVCKFEGDINQLVSETPVPDRVAEVAEEEVAEEEEVTEVEGPEEAEHEVGETDKEEADEEE